MTDKDKKIDLLLKQNAEEELAGFDYELLNNRITEQIDKVEKEVPTVNRIRWVFRAAACIAAAALAGVFLLQVMYNNNKPIQIAEGKKAVVEFIDRKAVSSIAISSQSTGTRIEITLKREKTFATVNIRPQEHQACSVKIHDLPWETKEAGMRASWVIIEITENAKIEDSEDEAEFFCMM